MSALSRLARPLSAGAVTVAYQAVTRLRDGLAALATRRGWTPALLPYSGYASDGRARVLARVVLAPAHVDPAARRGIAAWRRLVTLERPDVEVEVEFGGVTTTATSDDGGLVDATLDLSEATTAGTTVAHLRVPGRPSVEVPVHAVAEGPVRGVVCDVDDTVWVTGLAHPLAAAHRTFLGNSSSRRSVPGMAHLLQEAVRGQQHPTVVYLSNGPWNFAGVVTRFLAKNGFPAGAILMTNWGVTPDRWFRDGKAHKASSLRRLHEDFPDVRWVLVGDDGEHDPVLYADFAREHPEAVAAIALRQTGAAGQGGRGAGQVTDVVGVPVVRGADGDALRPLLRDALRDD